MKVIIVFQRAVKAKPSGSEELVLQMARDESRFIKPSDCTSKDSKPPPPLQPGDEFFWD
jgi:hypothetical protein